MYNLAKRVHDHQYRIDPIIRYLTDIDFYKLSMLQLIWDNHYNVHIEFSLTNRTKTVLLANEIDIEELRAQLDHVANLKWTQQELNFLRAQEFYGERNLFRNGFLDYLEHSWKLSPYHLNATDDGQIELSFNGRWTEVSLWEIYALAIVNEMRSRHLMRNMSRMDLDLMYSRAKVKLHKKLARVAECGATISDFGTRRRHSHLWQEYAIMAAKDRLGDKLVGTSNVYMAMKHGLPAVGTNAHELSMVMAGLAKTDEELKQSQYKVCSEWQDYYRDGMRIILPDAYGTTQFLRDAPSHLALWKGARPDSKDPYAAAEEFIQWWEDHGENPKEKMIIFSDGMDVHLDGHDAHGKDICALHMLFKNRIIPTFGWGTMLTNDFYDCHEDPKYMRPISVVCKVSRVEGRPAVKLSDNYMKAASVPTEEGYAEIERYRRVFGNDGMEGIEVEV